MIQKKQFICICMKHVRNFQLSTENPLDQDYSFTHLIYSTQGTVQELHVCHTMCPCVIHCTCAAECPPAMRELGSSLCERIWVTMYTEMNRLYYILQETPKTSSRPCDTTGSLYWTPLSSVQEHHAIIQHDLCVVFLVFEFFFFKKRRNTLT